MRRTFQNERRIIFFFFVAVIIEAVTHSDEAVFNCFVLHVFVFTQSNIQLDQKVFCGFPIHCVCNFKKIKTKFATMRTADKEARRENNIANVLSFIVNFGFGEAQIYCIE